MNKFLIRFAVGLCVGAFFAISLIAIFSLIFGL